MLNKFILNILTILVALLIFLVLPVLIIISLPIFLLRWLIGKIAKVLNPSLGKMVQVRSAVIVALDNWKTAPRTNILVQFVIQGNLDVSEARKLFKERVLKAKLPNGEFLYPELKQFLTKFLGFYFWKDDPTFNLANHFKLYSNKELHRDKKWTEEDLKEIRNEKVVKVWDKKKPLWEVVVLNNYYSADDEEVVKKPQSVFIIVFHHSIGDGYSWLRLFGNKMFETKPGFKNDVPDYPKEGWVSKIAKGLVFPVVLPYFLAKTVITSKRNLPWSLDARQLKVGKIYGDITSKIRVDKVKEIKSHFGVSFSSVIFAIVSGALRDVLVRKGSCVEGSLPCMSAFPMPGHSEKLRNYITGVTLTLPIGEPDAIKRLMYCSQDYERLKRSFEPLVSSVGQWFLGCHFPWLLEQLVGAQPATVGLTNFPGGVNPYYLCGNKVTESTFMTSLVFAGITFCALTYTDTLKIIPVVDAELMSKEELREFTCLIEKNLDVLYESMG